MQVHTYICLSGMMSTSLSKSGNSVKVKFRNQLRHVSTVRQCLAGHAKYFCVYIIDIHSLVKEYVLDLHCAAGLVYRNSIILQDSIQTRKLS